MTTEFRLSDETLRALTDKIMDACAALACYTEVAGETTRPFLCPTTRQVHEYLTRWADALGMSTHEDAAGNLRSRLAGPTPDAPTLYIGSHLDTVPNAGAYDGILGVVMGYAMLEAVKGQPLPYAVEVVGFSEEEGRALRRAVYRQPGADRHGGRDAGAARRGGPERARRHHSTTA